MNKAFQLIAWITILTALGLMVVSLYWLFYPYKVVSFKSVVKNSAVPIHKVENKIVKSGGTLIYYVDYCKYTSSTPEITKSFVDGLIYQIPPAVSMITKVGCGVNTIYIDVPESLPVKDDVKKISGIYSIKITWVFPLNPIRKETLLTQTEEFTVIK